MQCINPGFDGCNAEKEIEACSGLFGKRSSEEFVRSRHQEQQLQRFKLYKLSTSCVVLGDDMIGHKATVDAALAGGCGCDVQSKVI